LGAGNTGAPRRVARNAVSPYNAGVRDGHPNAIERDLVATDDEFDEELEGEDDLDLDEVVELDDEIELEELPDGELSNIAIVLNGSDAVLGFATVPVDFGDDEADITFVDDCITVDDTATEGPQDAEVCLADLVDGSKTFEYSRQITAPAGQCTNFTVDNTASFAAPSGEDGEATAVGGEAVAVRALDAHEEAVSAQPAEVVGHLVGAVRMSAPL
jgi:hypothetical protein